MPTNCGTRVGEHEHQQEDDARTRHDQPLGALPRRDSNPEFNGALPHYRKLSTSSQLSKVEDRAAPRGADVQIDVVYDRVAPVDDQAGAVGFVIRRPLRFAG